jgi:Glycoside-hydrolase family GH114
MAARASVVPPPAPAEADRGHIATPIRLTAACQSALAIMRIGVTVGMLALGLLAATACGSEADEVDRGSQGIVPPPDARWQYQLQASRAGDDASGRIDVDICERPFIGGPACVSPSVIDFDLYLDDRGPGVDNRLNRRAVTALHDRGGYAICYVNAGSIESYRPDFRRFVRWHRRHGRSLLGSRSAGDSRTSAGPMSAAGGSARSCCG